MSNGRVSHEDVADAWENTHSIRKTSKNLGISTHTVRRILLDAGIDCSQRATSIREQLEGGENPEHIASVLGMKVKTLKGYLPYSRGSYAVGERTANARRIAAWRDKKKYTG